MVSSSETEEILEGAVSGIARVALAIAAIPTEHRKQALLAAERSYLQTALALGYGEAAACLRDWPPLLGLFSLGSVHGRNQSSIRTGLTEQGCGANGQRRCPRMLRAA